MKAGEVHNLQQAQRNHFVQKVGNWSIPRKLTGVDRYYTNVNSLPVPQEKNDFHLLLDFSFKAVKVVIKDEVLTKD
jgi:hypothetical protein